MSNLPGINSAPYKGYWPPCDNEDCQIQAELGGYVWEGRDGLPAWRADLDMKGVQCAFCGRTLRDFNDPEKRDFK